STGRRAARSSRRRLRLAGDPHHLERRVVVGPPVEPAVERLDLEPRDVDQPLELGAPDPPEPQRPGFLVAPAARDVDPAVGPDVAGDLPRVAPLLPGPV